MNWSRRWLNWRKIYDILALHIYAAGQSRDEFNFLRYHEKYPKAILLTICEISEEQYKALNEHITKL